MFKNVLSSSKLLSDYRNCQLFNIYKSVYYLFLTRATSPSSLQLEFDTELDVPATVAGAEGEAG